MATRAQGRGGECGRGTTDGAGAQRGAAILERDGAGGTTGHRGGKGDTGAIGRGGRRGCQSGCAGRQVHRLGQGAAGATGVICIAAVNRRDTVAAAGQSRGSVRGCGTTDGAGAQRGAAILERDRTGDTTGHRGGECDAGPVGRGSRRSGQGCGGGRLVHRLAQGAAGAASVVTIATVNRRDAMATRAQGRGRVRGRGATDGAGAERGAAVLERDGAGGTTGHRGGEGDAGAVGNRIRGTGQGCGGGRLVHRLAQGAAGAAGEVTIATVNRRDAMATRSQGRGRVRGRGATNSSGAQCGAAILERHRTGGTTGHSGGEGNAGAVGNRIRGTGQACGGTCLVHRLA